MPEHQTKAALAKAIAAVRHRQVWARNADEHKRATLRLDQLLDQWLRLDGPDT